MNLMRRLLLPCLLIYSIILFRAATQAVTLDEADGFLSFSTGNLDASFYPSSGNHVLQSLLARYSTQWFGLSQFTFRIPAMMGAAIYLLAVASIINRIAATRQLLSFAILTLNPFVLDYLIASRGYALALGFLAAATALAMSLLDHVPKDSRASFQSRDRKGAGLPPFSENALALLKASALSLCCALAIAANFSFAFCVLETVAAFLLILVVRRQPHWLSISAAATLPGLAAGYVLVGQTIKDYPRSQLYYGAETWAALWTELLDATFPRQNLSLQAIHLDPILDVARQAAAYLILIPIGIAIWTALTTKSWPIRFVGLALTFTLTAHGLAHTLQGLLLPLDRTALFIVFFLSILAVYGCTAAPALIARRASAAVLCASLAIFAIAFRTNYFRIWDFDLDVNRGFESYRKYAKDHPIESVGCTWRYVGAYNFYRLAFKVNLPACEYIDQDNPPPRSVYFLHTPGQAEFVNRAKLKIIYEGPASGLIVAALP